MGNPYESGYENYNSFTLKLGTNGETITDERNVTYDSSNLTGEYNGAEFTILAGASIKLYAGGNIVVTNAKVYTSGMNIEGLNPGDDAETENEGEQEGTTQTGSQNTTEENENDNSDIISYFVGERRFCSINRKT